MRENWMQWGRRNSSKGFWCRMREAWCRRGKWVDTDFLVTAGIFLIVVYINTKMYANPKCATDWSDPCYHHQDLGGQCPYHRAVPLFPPSSRCLILWPTFHSWYSLVLVSVTSRSKARIIPNPDFQYHWSLLPILNFIPMERYSMCCMVVISSVFVKTAHLFCYSSAHVHCHLIIHFVMMPQFADLLCYWWRGRFPLVELLWIMLCSPALCCYKRMPETA